MGQTAEFRSIRGKICRLSHDTGQTETLGDDVLAVEAVDGIADTEREGHDRIGRASRHARPVDVGGERPQPGVRVVGREPFADRAEGADGIDGIEGCFTFGIDGADGGFDDGFIVGDPPDGGAIGGFANGSVAAFSSVLGTRRIAAAMPTADALPSESFRAIEPKVPSASKSCNCDP